MSDASMPMDLLRLHNQGKPLTPNEIKAVRLIALGYTQGEAAQKLGKSLETVRKQMKMVRAKLNAKTNAQAVAIALSLDMI